MLPKRTEKLLSLRLKRRKKNEIRGGGHLLFAQIAIVLFVFFVFFLHRKKRKMCKQKNNGDRNSF
jgi:hypothetical protein